ncbi:transposase [Streptomyces sp. NPDC050658]|uniref:transposase n=1 Tax=unclassified Streptomyces TaxID=2593676 RepID=UPI0034385C69
MAAPRKYSLELREPAVRMYCTTTPKPQIKKLAIYLGVHPGALHGWIRQAEADADERDDRLSACVRTAKCGSARHDCWRWGWPLRDNPSLGWLLMDRLTDDLLLLELLCAADDVRVPGELESSGPHEKAPGAVVNAYVVDGGRLLLTLWRGRLHEVIYQTPAESAEDASRRNDRLFAHYGQGGGWTEVLDNGFGKTYRRTDQRRYALWSYVMDIATFGTMDFHQVK